MRLGRSADASRTIAIVSATPGEGRTTTTLNLGIVLAEAGSRVALVDADLRRPCIDQALFRAWGCGPRAESDAGLATVLAGLARLEDVMVPTPLERLLLLPAGTSEASPGELLGSARLRVVLDGLLESVDFLLIDTPACAVHSDAVFVAGAADGVLYVVRAGTQTSVHDLASKQLRRAGVTLLGVVWNDGKVEGANASRRPWSRVQRSRSHRAHVPSSARAVGEGRAIAGEPHEDEY